MPGKRQTLHIVQDLATPHNNSLIRALRQRDGLRIVTWYAMRTSSALPWKEGLGGEVDNYYFDSWTNKARLMWTALFRPQERFMVIGYANFGTRFVLLTSWLLRRRFIYWTDNPAEHARSRLRNLLHKWALNIVRSRARPVFAVGRHTLGHLRDMGFSEEQMANLPVYIDLPLVDSALARPAIREKYHVSDEQVLLVGASRLAYDKGYDLLIEGLARLDKPSLERVKLVIVGHGPELQRLGDMVSEPQLTGHVIFDGWLEPDEYERTIAAADVFVHPARFDAFGGGTLFAMAVGVPVVGSQGAGAVLERVEHGVSGLVYPAEDTAALAGCLKQLIDNPAQREAMGQAARQTAEQWPPSRGAETVHDALTGKLALEGVVQA